jgi:cell wall-associated NlpC family hydrolase
MSGVGSRFAGVLVCCAGLLAGCASTGAVPAPFPRPGVPDSVPPAPAEVSPPPVVDRTGYGIAGTALSFRGAPYRNGGNDPSGFDCSGFVTYVFAQHGIGVPRTVSEQYQAGRSVPPDQLEPGDLVFFATVSHGASHVGIAIGGDEFVHAPSGHGEVRVERLSASYWASRFIGARRVS